MTFRDDAIEALIRIQEEAESSEDPTKELYGLTYDLLNRLRQLDGLGLSIANPHVNEQDWEIGGNLPVELSWDCLAANMKIYNEAYPLFLRGQLRLRILQQIPSVHAEVWRTYANKPRAKTYIDEAHDLINRFIRMIGRILTDFDYEKERTKKGFLEEYKKLSSRWGIREYSLSDLDELESNLNWEWGCILDRRELSQPNRNSPRTDPTTTPSKAKGKGGRPRKGSKSNKDLLIAILLKHHRYNLPGKDLSTDPISTKDACKQLEKSSSVLSNTWPAIKEGLTYEKYRVICRNYRTLETFLKAIDSREGYLERTNNEDAIGYAEE
jgi:hypothetical protein